MSEHSAYALQLHREHEARMHKFFPPPKPHLAKQSAPVGEPPMECPPEQLALPIELPPPPIVVRPRLELVETYLPAEWPPKVRDVVRFVCCQMQVPVANVMSHQRRAAVCWPRQIAMYLSTLVTGKSLVEIGYAMDKRDHTTVLHARDKIAAMRQVDPAFDRKLTDWACFLKQQGRI